MIRYALACEAGHGFESWFPSSDSYDAQAGRGLVTCPACGSAHVVKTMMAPAIGRGDQARAVAVPSDQDAAGAPAPDAVPADSVPMIAEPEARLRAMLRAIRESVTRIADDVGARFPEEARRMHYREAAARPIYGEASPAEARALVEEGIDVAPLPPMPDDSH